MDLSSDNDLAQLAMDVNRYYERLVELYWHQLKAFTLSRIGSLQDAEDIVQEAFMRAYIALDHYSVEQIQTLKVRAWLYKITWNVCCNHITRSKDTLSTPLDLTTEHAWLDREDEREEHPESILEHMERRQELEALVATLPQHYRVPLGLYYFEGLKYHEIADVLNQPIGTVKVYVHRGLRLLRKALAMQGNEVG